MTVTYKYVLVDIEGTELDHEYDGYGEAVNAAKVDNGSYAVVEREYEYVDTSLVWTPGNTTGWPPDDHS